MLEIPIKVEYLRSSQTATKEMQTVEEIKAHLGHGDYVKIGKMVGITRKYARILMDRPDASLHKVVLKAAKRLAKTNRKLGV